MESYTMSLLETRRKTSSEKMGKWEELKRGPSPLGTRLSGPIESSVLTFYKFQRQRSCSCSAARDGPKCSVV